MHVLEHAVEASDFEVLGVCLEMVSVDLLHPLEIGGFSGSSLPPSQMVFQTRICRIKLQFFFHPHGLNAKIGSGSVNDGWLGEFIILECHDTTKIFPPVEVIDGKTVKALELPIAVSVGCAVASNCHGYSLFAGVSEASLTPSKLIAAWNGSKLAALEEHVGTGLPKHLFTL